MLSSSEGVWYALFMNRSGIKERTMCFAISFVLLVTSLCFAETDTNQPSAIRVYVIQPACFEYIFTSVMDGGGGKQKLSFNHINGRTVFAGVGDEIGEYKVKSYAPSVERVFNKSVNTYLEKKSGKVTLRSPDGASVALEMGKVLSRPGWTACLVWVDSGNWMYAGDDDPVPAGGDEISRAAISADSVVLSCKSRRQTVPFISDKEKADLAVIWEQRKKNREEAGRIAEKKTESQEPGIVATVIRHAPPVEPIDPPRRVVEVKASPQFFYGTEYRYPVEFETVPVVERTASGVTVIKNAIVVPKRFQGFTSGYGMTIDGGGSRMSITR